MSQFYFDPSRASDPHALPDGETFYAASDEIAASDEPSDYLSEGWYYWPCFPGCAPDSDPVGPFGSEAAAIGEAQDDYLEGL